jgi:hypothetical protein
MIVGDPSRFAIESEITIAYERPSFMALGFFVIHVMGRCFGVKESDATMLACSFDEVGRRINRRGTHAFPILMEAAAYGIAEALRRGGYYDSTKVDCFFGMPSSEFNEAISSNHLVWAPDGDEAFDDGSYVLHLEDADSVRLIAFVSNSDLPFDTASLCEVRLSPEDFYGVLEQWHQGFRSEWLFSSKAPDGASLESSH